MRKTSQLAFTLIELLVVIAIIGILSGIIMVSMSGSTESARIAKLRVFGNSVRDVLGANLVSEWKLDGNGNDTWNNKTLTLVNSPSSNSSCPQGSCYDFNGTTQYAYVADDPLFNFGDKMSAFLWVKGAAQTSYKGIFAQYDNGTPQKMAWYLGVYSGTSYNQIQIVLSSDGTSNSGYFKSFVSNDAVFDSNWHYIGFTWNNGTMLMYVDGQSIAFTASGTLSSNSIYNSNVNLTIGSFLNSGSPAGYFAGSIDEARLYNAALPTSQIRENYLAGLNKLLSNGGITQQEYDQRIAELNQSCAEK